MDGYLDDWLVLIIVNVWVWIDEVMVVVNVIDMVYCWLVFVGFGVCWWEVGDFMWVWMILFFFV